MTVRDENFRETVLRVLADLQMRTILEACRYRPRSAVEITRDFNIPKTSVYRHLEELLRHGLLVVDHVAVTPDGKRYDLYLSRYESIDVRFANGVELTMRPNRMISARVCKFFSLEEPG